LMPNGAVVPLTPTFSPDWFMRACDNARQLEEPNNTFKECVA
jgi:hypothetical protein